MQPSDVKANGNGAVRAGVKIAILGDYQESRLVQDAGRRAACTRVRIA